MATFTWTATTAGGVNPWETPADWSNGTTATPNFTGGDDFIIPPANTNTFTINQIGTQPANAPDVANSLLFEDQAAFLDLADGGALTVSTTLLVNGLFDLGTKTGGSVLTMGATGGGGTITLGTNGRLQGALGDSIVNAGTATVINGGGTVIAKSGIFTIGSLVTVDSAATTKFQINSAATLSFADAVNGGTILFAAANNTVLDVAALSTFKPMVKGLFAGAGKNTIVNNIDFLNVGTAATAVMSNITATGATITVSTDTVSQSFPVLGNYVGKFVNYQSDGAGGTNVFITDTPCYGAGTAILTPGGEIAIETIQAGDWVMTRQAGALLPRPVIWAGVREIDLDRHPSPEKVAPIRFRAGSLGPGKPARDLLLSPDHCLFVDGALIPARRLINGMTICRDRATGTITYHHIELEQHAVLIAEGVEAESYLDTGNRALFGNAGLATILHPEFTLNEHLRCWADDACGTLLTRPGEVKPVWDRFADRAMELGYSKPAPPISTDPKLRLRVDGAMLHPLATEQRPDGTVIRFILPAGAGSVRLLSRTAAPNTLRPWIDDPRPLGVAVRAVTLRDRTGETVLPADHPALTDGWHPAEQSESGAPWRWSAGDACLPITADGPCVVAITLGETATYLAA